MNLDFSKDESACFICKRQPIRRMCLSDQCIKSNQFLFCDLCRKNQQMRKYASEVYQIDSFSGPISLFSINSRHRQQSDTIRKNLQYCKQRVESKIQNFLNNFQLIGPSTIQWLETLTETFDSTTSQDIETLFKNPPNNSYKQIQNKIQMLKWLILNKQTIQDPRQLINKIESYSKYFDQRLQECFSKMEEQIKQFINDTSFSQFFQGDKKIDRTKSKNIQHISKNNKKKYSSNQQKKSPNYLYGNGEKQQKKNLNNIIQKVFPAPHIKMDFEQQQKSQKSVLNQNKQIEVSIKQALPKKQYASYVPNPKQEANYQQGSQPKTSIQQITIEQDKQIIQQRKIIKKKIPAKIMTGTEKIAIQQKQQNKIPPLILQKIKKKEDFSDDEILIVNLRTLAQIFYYFDPNLRSKLSAQRSQKQKQNQLKYQQKILEQIANNDQKRKILSKQSCQIQKVKQIKYQNIKYLEIQQLPKVHAVKFKYTHPNSKRTVDVPYSLTQLHRKVQEMKNLQQIHVFSSTFFSNEQDLLSILFTSPSLHVVSLNCYNPSNKSIMNYKDIIQETTNTEMQIFQIAGNIPFSQNLQQADLKRYFPQSQKNQKLFDEYFALTYNNFIKKENENLHQQLKQNQLFQHKHSCWFVPKQKRYIEKQRDPIIITPKENQYILKTFSQLRNCWIPYLNKQAFEEQIQGINPQKIQHLSLGFHNFVLQTIPDSFFSGENSFSKILTNLKSLNLINLKIWDMFLKGFFSKSCKNLESLKIQFCMNLKKEFYNNLPKYCPKLKKLYINNLSKQINGDFILMFQQLQILILPWSQFIYNKSENLISMQKESQNQEKSQNGKYNLENQKRKSLNQEKMIPQSQQNKSNSPARKKFTFINLYGCTWFNTQFFAAIDLQSLQHLNIGKCKRVNLKQLIFYLKMCENLKSLCLDEIEITNQQLFKILKPLVNLEKLSIANCPNLNFEKGYLSQNQVQILDKMTHLDLRNSEHPISHIYTLKLSKPKYMAISRGFQVEADQLKELTQKQILAFSEFY